MKIIVWLWNPWIQYEKTKHNLGFLFLDWLVDKENFEDFKLESKFKWLISYWIFEGEKVILLKPITYMNLSWESLRLIMDFYKLKLDDLIVIYDDISMEFWKVRFRKTGTAWWHNWIKSIISHIWSDFKRIKVWIWFDEKFDVSDWVLSKFKKDELNEFEKDIFLKTLTYLKEYL